MDIHELRELMLDIECMTALRHVMDKPAMAALYRLVCDCANDGTSENELVWRRLPRAGAALPALRWRACSLRRARWRRCARAWTPTVCPTA